MNQADIDHRMKQIDQKRFMDLTFCATFLCCGTCDYCVVKLARDGDLNERPLIF